MLIINDFFKRHKEAVSNQMEALLKETGGKIVTATRFMRQRAFQKEDREDSIYIYPPFLYHLVLFFQMIFNHDDIHIFEEEPQFEKRFLFNLFRKNVYVSMYREPFYEYAEHLKKYKYLKGVYVELEYHKDLLVEWGIDPSIVHVTYTPAKVSRCKNKKKFSSKDIHLLFASWNNKEGNPLYERGLVYLLDLLVLNSNFSLTVLLRDNSTKEFIQMIKSRNLENRVRLVDVLEENLEQEFDQSDFVVFMIQKKLTKDVPNSLIDGISRGKPLMLTDVFGFAKIVKEENIGYVMKPNTEPVVMNITEKKYKEMSENAYNVSKKYTNQNYVNSIIKYYEGKK